MGAGQAFQRILAALDTVGNIDKIRTGGASLIAHHHAGQPEIPHVAAGVFLGQNVRRNAPFPAAGVIVRRKTVVGRGEQSAQVALADAAPVIQVQQMPAFIHPHTVTGASGLQ